MLQCHVSQSYDYTNFEQTSTTSLRLSRQLEVKVTVNVSDFLGCIFFLIQMSSIFACGFPLHRKTYPPILVCWFLFHFPQITYAKMHFFSWRHPFQRKILFFQTIESAKRAFAAKAGSRKPALFLEKQNSRKNYGAMFSR